MGSRVLYFLGTVGSAKTLSLKCVRTGLVGLNPTRFMYVSNFEMTQSRFSCEKVGDDLVKVVALDDINVVHVDDWFLFENLCPLVALQIAKLATDNGEGRLKRSIFLLSSNEGMCSREELDGRSGAKLLKLCGGSTRVRDLFATEWTNDAVREVLADPYKAQIDDADKFFYQLSFHAFPVLGIELQPLVDGHVDKETVLNITHCIVKQMRCGYKLPIVRETNKEYVNAVYRAVTVDNHGIQMGRNIATKLVKRVKEVMKTIPEDRLRNRNYDGLSIQLSCQHGALRRLGTDELRSQLQKFLPENICPCLDIREIDTITLKALDQVLHDTSTKCDENDAQVTHLTVLAQTLASVLAETLNRDCNGIWCRLVRSRHLRVVPEHGAFVDIRFGSSQKLNFTFPQPDDCPKLETAWLFFNKELNHQDALAYFLE